MPLEVKVLETDEEFAQLIPLILEFCKKTNLPIYQSFYEICEGFKNPYNITIIAKLSGIIVAYINGMFLNASEYFGNQVISKDHEISVEYYLEFEKKLISMGCKKIFMHTNLDPKVFEKYGLKFNRYLLMKEIGKEEE